LSEPDIISARGSGRATTFWPSDLPFWRPICKVSVDCLLPSEIVDNRHVVLRHVKQAGDLGYFKSGAAQQCHLIALALHVLDEQQAEQAGELLLRRYCGIVRDTRDSLGLFFSVWHSGAR